MKNFKTIVMENHMASMPHGLLAAKTEAHLRDSEYEHTDGGGVDGGTSKVFTHKFDEYRHGDDDENEDAYDAQFHYHMYGPDKHELEDHLGSLGWKHAPMHGTYIETPHSRIHTTAYHHPNGAVLTKTSITDANRDPHHSWTLSHPKEQA